MLKTITMHSLLGDSGPAPNMGATRTGGRHRADQHRAPSPLPDGCNFWRSAPAGSIYCTVIVSFIVGCMPQNTL